MIIELSPYLLSINWLVTKHKMFRCVLYNVKIAFKQFSLTIYPPIRIKPLEINMQIKYAVSCLWPKTSQEQLSKKGWLELLVSGLSILHSKGSMVKSPSRGSVIHLTFSTFQPIVRLQKGGLEGEHLPSDQPQPIRLHLLKLPQPSIRVPNWRPLLKHINLWEKLQTQIRTCT